MPERIATAHGDRFRELTRLERLGNALRAPLAHVPGRERLRAVYHRLLLAGTGGRGLRSTLPGGETIRILPEFRYVTWNLEEYEAFTRALRPGAVALDVGANVGCYTIMFGQVVGPAGAVYAFEPSPPALGGLTRHVTLNRLDATVTVVAAAVSDHSGEGRLVTGGPMGTDHLDRSTGVADASTTRVDVISLDDFCERNGVAPDLIKVDVEGVELAVLRGARRTIAAYRSRLALFVELHPSVWPRLGTSREALAAELDAQGLAVEALQPGTDPWTTQGACVRLVPARTSH